MGKSIWRLAGASIGGCCPCSSDEKERVDGKLFREGPLLNVQLGALRSTEAIAARMVLQECASGHASFPAQENYPDTTALAHQLVFMHAKKNLGTGGQSTELPFHRHRNGAPQATAHCWQRDDVLRSNHEQRCGWSPT